MQRSTWRTSACDETSECCGQMVVRSGTEVADDDGGTNVADVPRAGCRGAAKEATRSRREGVQRALGGRGRGSRTAEALQLVRYEASTHLRVRGMDVVLTSCT